MRQLTMLGLLAALVMSGFSVAQAGDKACCETGKSCCKPGAKCCDK